MSDFAASDTIQAVAAPPIRRDILTRITPERSRELAGKAAEGRRRSQEAKEARKLVIEAMALQIPRQPPAAVHAPPPEPTIPTPSPEPKSGRSFTGGQLVRVRERLVKLGSIMDSELAAGEPDPKRLRELADAMMKLSDLERVLDGRPQPGSLRPVAQTKRSRGAELLSE